MNFRLTALTCSALGLIALCTLTGCTMENTAAPSSTFVPGATISGVVHGGQQPISGARIYLLALNPTGYGGPGIAASASNASISLLSAASTGNSADSIGSYALTAPTTGSFNLAGEYNCASGFAQSTGAAVALSGNEQVYLYVLGGQPINSASANTSSGLLVALGSCSSPTTQITINEITTAATAYAFAGFATDATHIGSSGSTLALTNLSNAFANYGSLVVSSTGVPTANSGSIYRPIAQIYTIGDILAACINSTGSNGSTGSSGACSTLFSYTASGGATGTTPTDTATAAINLAHNPWPTAAGMKALYGLVPAIGAPFAGGLSSQPNDFTVAINYGVSGLSYPSAMAIDNAGDVWVVNSGFPGSLTKISPTGGLLATASGNGVQTPDSIAIDTNGYVWVASDSSQKSLSRFTSAGGAAGNFSSCDYYLNGQYVSTLKTIAIAASNHLWMAADQANDVCEYDGNGTSEPPGIGAGRPSEVAIDASGHVWLASEHNSVVIEGGNSTYTSGGGGTDGLSTPNGIAFDLSGNAWFANQGNNSLSVFSPTPSSVNGLLVGIENYTGGGLNSPTGIASDSAGQMWIGNFSGSTGVSEFSSTGVALSPAPNGYIGPSTGNFNEAMSVAVDGSGDVWAANYGGTSVTELIGAAAPVVTPLTANLDPPYGTATANLP